MGNEVSRRGWRQPPEQHHDDLPLRINFNNRPHGVNFITFGALKMSGKKPLLHLNEEGNSFD
jgi:hypothetical protein